MDTYGDIGQRTAGHAASKALKHAVPIIVFNLFGLTKPLPRNKAEQIKYRRRTPNTISTVPLVEGVTPAAKGIGYEDVSVTLQQFGGLMELTDRVEDLSEDPVLKDMMLLSGEEAAETSEMVTYGVLKGGTNVVYANGTARNQVNTPVSKNVQRLAVRALKNARAKRITKVMDGSVKIGTRPVESGFVFIGHTDLEADIRDLPGFVPVAEYGSRKPLCAEEIGSNEDGRYITTPLAAPFADAGGAHGNTVLSTSGVNADVYPLIVLAEDAFAHVPLKGDKGKGVNFHPMVLNPNTPRGGDPLGQKGSVGWKCYLAPLILNQLWMVRMEVAASDLV